jgi:tRNA(Arg) A34 adenosine deaminase TadA
MEDEQDIHFMQLALAQAHRASLLGEVPIGAVVVHEGAPVAYGHNRREIDADPSAHAEFTALIAATHALGRWRLTGCTVYVTLEPCIMCAGLMHQARIDRCVYGASDPKAGALGTLYRIHDDERLNHRFAVAGGVCERECADLLRSFFVNLRTKGQGTRAEASPE